MVLIGHVIFFPGLQVAIKKINNVFDHVSDATRILREIKLLRLLRHPGGLPPHASASAFRSCARPLSHAELPTWSLPTCF